MAGRFQRMYEAEREKVLAFQRVKDSAANDKIVRAALRVINRRKLTAEFVAELSKLEREK